ncbi:RING/U-box superfamily protein [Trifolium repens]|nr:RING/U-box superfamily protein [Trifolium repens]
MIADTGDFAGTICSICYEGLNPITEDLQSVSICGHVFHELCLQQWFEYCASKKHTCPVCKAIGDVKESVVTQKQIGVEEDAGVLRKEVKRLEGKVSGLSTVLKKQTKELDELKDELATLGYGANSQETVDTLKRSLVLRNRNYKELMAKCNVPGRGEAHYRKKLEKAKEKITKTKARLQEMATTMEAKENGYLKQLKVAKNTENRINSTSDVFIANKFSSKEQNKQSTAPKYGMDLNKKDNNKPLQSLKTENSKATKNKDVNINNVSKPTVSPDKEIGCIIIDEDDYKGHDKVDLGMPETTPKTADITAGTMDEDVILQANAKQPEPMLNIRKESPLTTSSPVDICYSGGLFGPDGTQRYLGKWCNRGQNGESTSTKGNLIEVAKSKF